MQDLSFHSQRGTKTACLNHIKLCHLLHNLNELKKTLMQATGRDIGNLFREGLRVVKRNDTTFSIF